MILRRPFQFILAFCDSDNIKSTKKNQEILDIVY